MIDNNRKRYAKYPPRFRIGDKVEWMPHILEDLPKQFIVTNIEWSSVFGLYMYEIPKGLGSYSEDGLRKVYK